MMLSQLLLCHDFTFYHFVSKTILHQKSLKEMSVNISKDFQS